MKKTITLCLGLLCSVSAFAQNGCLPHQPCVCYHFPSNPFYLSDTVINTKANTKSTGDFTNPISPNFCQATSDVTITDGIMVVFQKAGTTKADATPLNNCAINRSDWTDNQPVHVKISRNTSGQYTCLVTAHP